MTNKKPVIICVDDEITILRSLRAELQEAISNDYLIEIAEDGEDTLELVEELLEDEYEIPLIISDQIMPEMKGDELLKRVHQLSPKTLKVMLTGQADLEAVGRAIKHAQLYRYIAKPWQSEDLQLTVTEAIHSYFQDKKLALKNAKLQELNQEQAALIAKLDQSERKFRSIFNNALEGIFQSTADGRYISANQALADIYGYDSPEELMATITNISEQLYVEPHNRTEFLALMAEYREVSDFESRVYRKNGSIIWISESVRTICDTDGTFCYYQGFVEDITVRKKAEAERTKFTKELFALNESFSRFVPRQFLQYLAHKSIAEVELGESVQKQMSVLFADIRSFTAHSEKMTPEDTFKFINGYLSRMESAIIENSGFIDKYIGDAIMALFAGGADQAVKAGVMMLQALAQYNLTRQRPERPPIQIGIGINTGKLILGTVGGKSRVDTTVIGDAVNLSSRLEQLTKVYKTPLLISHHTYASLTEPTNYAIRLIAQVKVRGKTQEVGVFEVFEADPPAQKEAKLATKSRFEAAIIHYGQEEVEEAKFLLSQCLQDNPGDSVAQFYWEKLG